MVEKKERALIGFLLSLIAGIVILMVTLMSFAQAAMFGSALLVSSLFIGIIISISSAFLYRLIFNHAWGIVTIIFSIFSLFIGLAFVALPPGVLQITIDIATYSIPIFISSQGSLAGIYGYSLFLAGVIGVIGGAFGIARK